MAGADDPTVVATSSASPRADRWRLATRTLHFADGPAVMGILNVTPDSFSDGGRFDRVDAAVEQAFRLEQEGAAILDIGGESTRPGAPVVSVDDELRRVMPVIERLVGRLTIPISIDTSKARVAREATAAGAEIINDVTGLEGDPEMLGTAIESQAGICAMHMRGNPRTMQLDTRYDDVVGQTLAYLQLRRDAIERAGIEPERVCLDPGIGFGKTHEQTFEMLRRVDRYLSLGRPVLIGHSRKGFLARLTGDPQRDRTAATVGVALACAARGVQVIRVHDVAATCEALRGFAIAGGCGEVAAVAAAERASRPETRRQERSG